MSDARSRSIETIVFVAVSGILIMSCIIFVHSMAPAFSLLIAFAALGIVALRSHRQLGVQDQSPIMQGQSDNATIASDVADCRVMLDETRKNVGMIADAVYNLRMDNEARAVHVDGIWECLDMQGRRIDEQSHNLGLVAGGMNDLRNANPRAELVEERYAAMGDAIAEIAAQVDSLDRRLSDRTQALASSGPNPIF